MKTLGRLLMDGGMQEDQHYTIGNLEKQQTVHAKRHSSTLDVAAEHLPVTPEQAKQNIGTDLFP